jgi:predicted nucleotidyltransferase
MNSKIKHEVLCQIKECIREIEPNAQIIFYGSRARDDDNDKSDWDFLILVDGIVADQRIDSIRHRLYEIEWKIGGVVSSIIRAQEEWNSPKYQSMPIFQNIQREGILL